MHGQKFPGLLFVGRASECTCRQMIDKIILQATKPITNTITPQTTNLTMDKRELLETKALLLTICVMRTGVTICYLQT